MASLTVPASFLGGSAIATAIRTPPTTKSTTHRGGFVVAKAAMRVPDDQSRDTLEAENSSSTKRRDLVFAGAAAAACALAKVAMADEEPKRGTPEARKKYAAVCVTMPTASICHK